MSDNKLNEPVAWRVTGPFEDKPFKDRSSAEAYRKGLNDGYGSDAYTVSPLYLPEAVEAAIEATKEKAAKVCDGIEQHELEDDFDCGIRIGANWCAAAIRSMK